MPFRLRRIGILKNSHGPVRAMFRLHGSFPLIRTTVPGEDGIVPGKGLSEKTGEDVVFFRGEKNISSRMVD